LVFSLLGRTADAAAEAASATTLTNEKEENIIRNKNEMKECVSVQYEIVQDERREERNVWLQMRGLRYLGDSARPNPP
jgi:hypothetical protein